MESSAARAVSPGRSSGRRVFRTAACSSSAKNGVRAAYFQYRSASSRSGSVQGFSGPA